MNTIVIYYSMTGNTQEIAQKIKGATSAEINEVGDISVEKALSFDNIILGCPAMGSEELEEEVFKPFYDELISKCSDKKVGLFGSYGWGDGEWMRTWQEDAQTHLGHDVVTLISNGGVSEIDEDEYQKFISYFL